MPDSPLLKQYLHREYPIVARGEGIFLYDTEGRRYLDGCGGAMTASLGHGDREIVEAAGRQASRVAFSYRTQFTNEPAEELARRLVGLAPGDLSSAFFVSSGSEATEFAMRASIGSWRERGRPEKTKILGRYQSYHGMTLGSLSMSGHPARRPDYGELLHPLAVAPPVHAYRWARAGESEEAYSERAVATFEAAIIRENPATVAAVIVEPIVGAAGGALVPPTGYLLGLREMCDRLDVLLVFDEVITGIGRAGEWFACIAEGVLPDVLVFGKGISAGYAPVAGALLREHMVDTFRRGSGVAPFGHTFSGNPVGAATCLAVLDRIEGADLLHNVGERGEQLDAGLRSLSEKFPFLVDVRGRGLLRGFEFVADPVTRQAPEPRHDVAGAFVRECFQRGLMVYPAGVAPLNNAALLAPAYTITSDEVDLLLEILADALDGFSKHEAFS